MEGATPGPLYKELKVEAAVEKAGGGLRFGRNPGRSPSWNAEK